MYKPGRSFAHQSTYLGEEARYPGLAEVAAPRRSGGEAGGLTADEKKGIRFRL